MISSRLKCVCVKVFVIFNMWSCISKLVLSDSLSSGDHDVCIAESLGEGCAFEETHGDASHSLSFGSSQGHSHDDEERSHYHGDLSQKEVRSDDPSDHSQQKNTPSHSPDVVFFGHSHGAKSQAHPLRHDSHIHPHEDRFRVHSNNGRSHGHAHSGESHGHSQGSESHGHSHSHSQISMKREDVIRESVWWMALFASWVVSCASLVCLAIIPVVSAARRVPLNTRPPEVLIQILTGFAVGAMLGDAFLHQLPHAFASAPPHSHSHSPDHHHSHSLWSGVREQATGLSVLGGILIFFLVEKVILHIGGGHSHSHSHARQGGTKQDQHGQPDGQQGELASSAGWLNLFADAVHNYTDGLAIGASFLSGGSFAGWSKTMFILAHELPQEVGDFGVLLSSGFNPLEALFFNFLSALVAMAGTLTALMIGSGGGMGAGLVEGFTAGGFIYISVASVIPAMHAKKHESTLQQVTSISAGIFICVLIHASGGCSN